MLGHGIKARIRDVGVFERRFAVLNLLSVVTALLFTIHVEVCNAGFYYGHRMRTPQTIERIYASLSTNLQWIFRAVKPYSKGTEHSAIDGLLYAVGHVGIV